MSLQRSAAGVGIARGLGLAAAVGFMLYTAHRFGSDRATDIVFNALIIPNALMAIISLFLPPALTSVFKSIEVVKGPDEAWSFGRSAPRLAAIVFFLVAAAGVLASPILARLMGASFRPEEVVRLARYMQVSFAVVFLAGISSVIKGILNAERVLFVPSMDTAAANVAGIAVAAFLVDRWGGLALVAAAVGGGVAKLILVLPQYAAKRRPGITRLLHPAMRGAISAFSPVAFNGLLLAATAAVMRTYAAGIPAVGAVSHLTYAERIYSAPPDLFVASLGVALLPAMSEHAAAGELDRVRHLTTVGLRMSFFFGIPAAVGLAMLAEPVVALLCQHGRFDAASTAGTAAALRGYAPALAFSGHLILYQAFYAMGRTRAILGSGLVMLAGTAIVGALLVRRYGQGGLGLGFSIAHGASWAVSLALFARVAGGWPDVKGLLSGMLRTSLCAAVMAGALWGMARMWPAPVLVRVALGAAVFLLFARFLCPVEWEQARKLRSRTDT
jgi:putative peptidoglycan lipid II flippase